jgi:hypothetical protein
MKSAGSFARSAAWRTETGELLGSYPNAVEDLAQGRLSTGTVFYQGLEDMVEQASSSVGSAVYLDRVYGSRGEEMFVEL